KDQVDPVTTAVKTFRELGAENGFTVHTASDPKVYTEENLAGYRGVVFLSAEGVELSSAQENALKAYVQGGGGFLGVRDAARAQARSQWFTGLIGTRPAGNLPDPLEGASVTASAENPPNEDAENLVDGDPNTKWLAFEPTAVIAPELAEAGGGTRYALPAANGVGGRDPQGWTLQASAGGETGSDRDTREGRGFPDRFTALDCPVETDTAYQHFRLDITGNRGDDLTQLA